MRFSNQLLTWCEIRSTFSLIYNYSLVNLSINIKLYLYLSSAARSYLGLIDYEKPSNLNLIWNAETGNPYLNENYYINENFRDLE